MTTSTVIIIVAVIAALLIGFIALVAYGSSQDEKAREQWQQKINAFKKEFDAFTQAVGTGASTVQKDTPGAHC